MICPTRTADLLDDFDCFFERGSFGTETESFVDTPVATDPPVEKGDRSEPRYLPSPAEIRAQCLSIQAEWSEEERRSRAPHLNQKSRWQVPVRKGLRETCGAEV